MCCLTYISILLIAFDYSVHAFTFPENIPRNKQQTKLQTRQNIPIEYAEPWDETGERADGEDLGEELPCTCMSVTKCGASMRNGETEENVCPVDGDVCCILSGADGIRDLPPAEEEGGGGTGPVVPPNGPQHCNCVPITECGATLRVDEEEEESEENVCANPGEVCCEPPPDDQEGKVENPPSSSHTTDPGYGGIGQDIEPPVIDEVSPLGCGQADVNFPTVYASMELTQQNARFGELPWTVLLYVSNPSEANNGVSDYKCAGSLIHPKLIITAAHCLDKQDLRSLTVRAGDWDLATSQEPLQHQDSKIESYIPHPNFVSGNTPFDLAVLVLTKPFTLTRNVNVICLPNYSLDEVDTNDCVSAGWGKSPSGLENSVMKKIVMPVVDKKKCQAALRTTRLGRYFKLHKSFMCAGGRADQDVCQGDGGGPLSCRAKPDGAMVLVGVTSWGIGCGKEGIPGVFADVLFLNSWLNDLLLRLVQDYKEEQ